MPSSSGESNAALKKALLVVIPSHFCNEAASIATPCETLWATSSEGGTLSTCSRQYSGRHDVADVAEHTVSYFSSMYLDLHGDG